MRLQKARKKGKEYETKRKKGRKEKYERERKKKTIEGEKKKRKRKSELGWIDCFGTRRRSESRGVEG